MADDFEEGPDPNDVRRHAKKMHTEMQYRQKYRRIDFYRPNPKQMEFHNLLVNEKMIRAGNQLGKTQSAAAQMTMDALSLYPGWYTGRQFIAPPKIERPYDFIGWYGCTTSDKTRDGAQVKLLGDIRQQGGLGTGLIPLDNIVGRPTMARGISDFVDTITLRRETGGAAILRGKTFAMGREAWQGEAVDVVWGDEDPGDFEIYGECQARLTTTDGCIIWSMSPMLGVTPVRRHFKEKKPGTQEVLMTIYDAAVSNGGHIPDDKIAGIIARYGSKAATRAFGGDMQGQGSVFETEPEAIKHTLDPAEVPLYWPWLWALDFRHSGQESGGHPFAAILLTWDRDNDVVYVMDAFRMFGMAANHVARIKQNPMRDAPVAWPHDGGTGAGVMTNDTIATVYKKAGLSMRPTHAVFPGGGYNFEAGIQVMEERLTAKRLRVAAHLFEWFDEYGGYHRVNGKVNKVDDDLLSATRVGIMDLPFAKTADRFPSYLRAAAAASVVADGIDFDVFATS
jgi:phage terminase large subunit-like protein